MATTITTAKVVPWSPNCKKTDETDYIVNYSCGFWSRNKSLMKTHCCRWSFITLQIAVMKLPSFTACCDIEEQRKVWHVFKRHAKRNVCMWQYTTCTSYLVDRDSSTSINISSLWVRLCTWSWRFFSSLVFISVAILFFSCCKLPRVVM